MSFNVGDIVTLNSGESEMTIEGIYNEGGITYSDCIYYNKDNVLLIQAHSINNLSLA